MNVSVDSDRSSPRILKLIGDLYSAATGLGALYVAAALTHAQLRSDLSLIEITVWLSGAVILFFALRWGLSHWSWLGRKMTWVGALAGVVILSISTFHLYLLSASRGNLENLLLLAVGVTIFFVPFRMLSLVLTTTLGFWVWMAWSSTPTFAWLYFAFGMLAAGGLRLQKEILKANRERHAALHSMSQALSKRRRAEQALVESHKRYSLISRGTNDGIWDWDLRTDQVYFSPRWKTMLGFNEDEIGSTPEEWFKRIHSQDRARVKKALGDHRRGVTDTCECEYRILHKDGKFRWMICRGLAARNESGNPTRMAGSQTDVTSQRLSEKQIFYAASYDSLTGLPNRALFLELLEGALKASRRRPDSRSAVLLLTLDQFPVINDSLGHVMGDRLLLQVAERIKSCLQGDDLVARVGEDEFAILLHRIDDLAGVMRIVDEIQARFAETFQLGEDSVFACASIGIASSNPRYQEPEELLRDARTAMRRAKKQAKASPELFDAGMRTEVVEELQRENELRLAIDRDQLDLHYQPLFNLASERVAGLEAHLCWNHPSQGLLEAGQFLPMAEDAGIRLRLGLWSIWEACRQLREWKEQLSLQEPLFVSVRLSPGQFQHPDLIQTIEDAYERFHLETGALALQISGTWLFRDPKISGSLASRLRHLGIRLHLDELGTGYSSLNDPQDFPFRAAAIHRNLIAGLRDESSHPALKAMLDLIQTLGMETIAEGVENSIQLSILRELKCDFAQGEYFSGPRQASDVGALLSRRSCLPPDPSQIRCGTPTLLTRLDRIAAPGLGHRALARWQ